LQLIEMAGGVKAKMPCWGLCHVLWGLCYVAAGAVQLVAGLFALYWLPVLGLGSNIVTGTWASRSATSNEY
jgi:hypothetical protein